MTFLLSVEKNVAALEMLKTEQKSKCINSIDVGHWRLWLLKEIACAADGDSIKEAL